MNANDAPIRINPPEPPAGWDDEIDDGEPEIDDSLFLDEEARS